MSRMVAKAWAISGLLIVSFVTALLLWRRPSVAVLMDGTYTNALGETRAWICITNPLPYQIKYQMLPVEEQSDVGWSKSEGHKVFVDGKAIETGLIYGGETLEPRSGFRFIDNRQTDRPYRYPVLWSLLPEAAAARPKWKQWVDRQATRLIARPITLPYGIARSPPITPKLSNQTLRQTGASGFTGESNRTPSAAGSRR